MASSRAITVPELLIVIAVLVIVILAALPIPPSSLGAAKRAQAKNDVTQIAAAVTAFETEYSRLPGTNAGPVGAELLEALVGNNKTLNPRQIVFIEIPIAKKGKSGLRNGTFVDPWGGPYQIAFDSDSDGNVTAGTNNVVVPKKVAVWNDPRLGNKEWNWNESTQNKLYVTSWNRLNP